MSGDYAHGSPLGFQAGCRTKAVCAWAGSSEHLTCVEAWTAWVGDARIHRLPRNLPLPRQAGDLPELLRFVARRHGTSWGWGTGCRTRSSCPNYLRDEPTCVDAKRTYHHRYLARRAGGSGSAIDHGTLRGYHAGCRDTATCPQRAGGNSCPEVRARHRRNGRDGPMTELVDVSAEVDLLAGMRQAGMSVRAIARECGLGRTTAANLLGAHRAGKRPMATTLIRDRIVEQLTTSADRKPVARPIGAGVSAEE